MARPIWSADCETDPFKRGRIPKPFLWGVYDGVAYHEFTDTKDFIKFVEKEKVILYAHNGGKFDWHFILDYLEPFTPINIINGRIAKFKIGECEFRDSYNILPIPLAQYNKEKIDYSIFEESEREKPENMKLISDYLKMDCVYLWQLVDAFIRDYGLNLTLAGSALKKWQVIENVKAPKTSRDFYEYLTPYYYGGRVECFVKGFIDHEFKVVDVNSAYPNAMMYEHPYGEHFESLDKLPDKNIESCFIRLKCISKGALPFRGENGLSFPNDDKIREYCITGWEYLAAVELNLISKIKIVEVIKFIEKITFKNYVNYFFKMKKEAKEAGDKAREIFSKLMLNSLYGKFCANPSDYREYMIIDPEFIDACEMDEGFEFDGELGKWALMSKELELQKQRYYNIAVGASITGFQRSLLLRALKKVKEPLYCDTDSIACVETADLVLSKELGDWSLEAECSEGAIAGKKLYAFKLKEPVIKKGEKVTHKIASKGVRLTAKEIYKIADGEEIIAETEFPTFSFKKGPVFIDRKIRLT